MLQLTPQVKKCCAAGSKFTSTQQHFLYTFFALQSPIITLAGPRGRGIRYVAQKVRAFCALAYLLPLHPTKPYFACASALVPHQELVGKSIAGMREVLFSKLSNQPPVLVILDGVDDVWNTETGANAFVKDLYAYAQTHPNHVNIIALSNRTDTHPPEWGPVVTLPELPPKEYKQFGLDFARASTRTLSEEAAALAAAYTLRSDQGIPYLKTLIRTAATLTDRFIDADMIRVAAIPFSTQSPYKEVLQGYASLFLHYTATNPAIDARAFSTPTKRLYDTVRTETELTPQEFNRAIRHLVGHNVFSEGHTTTGLSTITLAAPYNSPETLGALNIHLSHPTYAIPTPKPLNKTNTITRIKKPNQIATLWAITTLRAKQKISEPITTQQIYPLYTTYCQRLKTKPTHPKNFNKIINALDTRDLILKTLIYRGRGNGRQSWILDNNLIAECIPAVQQTFQTVKTAIYSKLGLLKKSLTNFMRGELCQQSRKKVPKLVPGCKPPPNPSQ